MKSAFSMCLLGMLFLWTLPAYAQQQTATVNCGQKIPLEFNSSKEMHEIKITLQAAGKLNFKVTPTGDYLNVRAEIYDPAGGKIYPTEPPARFNEPMFKGNARYLEVTTGRLSAGGVYTIKLFNYWKTYKKDERAGEYSFATTCYKSDGTVVGN